MFRRGIPFRPPMRVLGFLNPLLQQILCEANRAFEAGDYREAAERYARLAERAAVRGKNRAGNWMIKAGQANVLSVSKDTGMQQIFKGMEMLRNQGRQRDLGKYAWRSIDLLKSQGFMEESRLISEWISGKMPEIKIDSLDVTNAHQTTPLHRLPSKCPSCGAPAHPNTVDWVENGQAACGYCGNLLPEG